MEGVYAPNDRELSVLKDVYERYKLMRQAREKKYRYLGDRTPQKYWDECEKRFVGFAPPKDITEEDWQANVVMGITRNAVIQQIARAGLRVPEAKFSSFSKDGFVQNERSRIYRNLYTWSLQREQAERKQQYIALGNYVRGNACVYEGWEDCTQEVDLIIDTDPETGEVKSEKKEIRHWGPKRQVVPLDEIYYPNFFVNDIQDQPDIIWRQVMPYTQAEMLFSQMKNWKKVKPGFYAVGPQSEPFFKSTAVQTDKQVEVIRHYKNRKAVKGDRYRLIVQGVLLLDIPLPFNHKKLPFSWCHNEPLSDSFMLGMSVPFKVMNDQDTADSVWNMALDKNLLSMQKPVMTDDPDPSIRTYLSPGAIMQFTKGSIWTPAPIDGVSSGEFALLQEALRQAKEDSGVSGGGGSMTARGRQVTARQAIMMEEESKRILGISMTNLEMLERDIAAQRILNIKQFAPGAGEKLEAEGGEIDNGAKQGKGRFVAFMASSMKEAQGMKEQLSLVEQIGDIVNQPTEAVAIAPDWFDEDDRIEAEVVPESTYLRNKSVEQATEMENLTALAGIPMFAQMINWEEMLRDLMKTQGKDADKLIKMAPPPMPEAPQGMGPPSGGGPPGPVTSDLTEKPQPSLGALAGV